jgi:hypothetical protein
MACSEILYNNYIYIYTEVKEFRGVFVCLLLILFNIIVLLLLMGREGGKLPDPPFLFACA